MAHEADAVAQESSYWKSRLMEATCIPRTVRANREKCLYVHTSGTQPHRVLFTSADGDAGENADGRYGAGWMAMLWMMIVSPARS